MKKSLIILFAVFLPLCLTFAGKDTVIKANDTVKGIELVKTIWNEMKNGNVKKLSKIISTDFQSIHQDGARNKKQELELIKNLNLKYYTLKNFSVTKSNDIIMVIYDVEVFETINGEELKEVTSPRMSIFQKVGKKWLWIAHANLVTMKD
ncbi:MAG: nuclear transport factor 2 family protein [Victivallales bacterium]|nr:nuclear transport factor 2 family protein [Victivallales bacterium]MCF7888749.1 nuclear transport factor 2 family protein [Victivallales bacterium]